MLTKNNEKNYQRCWFALVGLGTAIFILNLDLTIVNLILPILGSTFHSKLSTLQWVNNIYSLTFAAFVIFAGKFADRIGHRSVFLYGVSLFLIGSVIAGVAINIDIVILGRLFQSFGMAGTFGMVFILASSSFPPERRSFAAGLLVIFVGLAQVFGPTIGGLIVEHWGWRWAFLISLWV